MNPMQEFMNNLSQKTPNSQAPAPRLTPVNYDPFAVDNTPLARQGVGGDTRIVHMTNGDIGIPVEKQTPQLLATLASALGGDLSPFTVGSGKVTTNPNTGFQSFEADPSGSDSDAGGAGNGPGMGAADSSDSSGPSGTGTSGNSPSANNPNATQDNETPSPSGPVAGQGDLSADTTDTPSTTGTKSATAVDESHGYTGIAATDYAGPATDLLGKVGEFINRAWENFTDISTKGLIAKGVDFTAGVLTGGISTLGNLGSKAVGGKSIGQAMVDNGNDTTTGNPADVGNDPGLSGGGSGQDSTDPAIQLAKLVRDMQIVGVKSPASTTPVRDINSSAAPPAGQVGFIDPSILMQDQAQRKFF